MAGYLRPNARNAPLDHSTLLRAAANFVTDLAHALLSFLLPEHELLLWPDIILRTSTVIVYPWRAWDANLSRGRTRFAAAGM